MKVFIIVIAVSLLMGYCTALNPFGAVITKSIGNALKESLKAGLRNTPKYGIQGVAVGAAGYGANAAIDAAKGGEQPSPAVGPPVYYIPQQAPVPVAPVSDLPPWVIATISLLASIIMGGLAFLGRRFIKCAKQNRDEPTVQYGGFNTVEWQSKDADRKDPGRSFNTRMNGHAFRLDGVRTQR